MTKERIAELRSHADDMYGPDRCAIDELLDAVEELQEDWQDERNFIEAIETALDAPHNGSVGSSILGTIDRMKARISELERDRERLDELASLSSFEVYRVLQSECTGYLTVIAIPGKREAEGKTIREVIDAVKDRK